MTKTKWQQISLDEFEEAALAGRYIWIADGVLGYARPMEVGETVRQAVTDFESAGESALDVRVYQDGVEEEPC